jgi:DNA polymerase IV
MQKAAMRLRKSSFLCSAVTVQIGFMKQDFLRTKPWGQSVRINPTEDTAALLTVLHTLLNEWALHAKVQSPLSVGIVLHELIPKSQVTLNLFDGETLGENVSKKNQAMDALNRQFGKNTVYYASAHGALSSAPMRIAFNRIPDLETET